MAALCSAAAARLQAAAPVGGVLIEATTYALVCDFVDAELVAPRELKGKSRPVSAYLVTGVRACVSGRPVRRAARMVGREPEVALDVSASMDTPG